MRAALRVLGIALVLAAFSGEILAQAKPWAPPRAGLWTVSGTDVEGTEWTGKMTLIRQGTRNGRRYYRGFFDWTSAEAEGRENFRGWFDRRTGIFRFSSYSVKSVSGDLGTGSYFSRIRDKGAKLIAGTWKGKDVVPGRWTAEWSGQK